MPLRNRVDPLGRIVALDQRGAFTGNRGVLHDDDATIVRTSANRAWITCRLQFRGRHRRLLQPGRWTELFFWDEATALAAGHRPCFECRRGDAVDFRDRFREVTGRTEAGAGDLDRVLAVDRRVPRHGWGSGRVLVLSEPSRLPDGTVVLLRDRAHLVHHDGLRPWSTIGWRAVVDPPDHEVALVTPRITARIIAAGYRPLVRLAED